MNLATATSQTALPGLLSLCKQFFQGFVAPGAVALDLTVGNGRDTVFLAGLVGGAGRVFGFDIQAEAIANTSRLLAELGFANTTLHQAGHERLAELLPPVHKGRIAAAMLNLGYLPGSDKRVVTRACSTLAALAQLQEWLAPGGGMSVHIYTGHPGGAEEGEAVLTWARALPWPQWKVAAYEMLNKAQNREILLLISQKPYS